MANTTARTAKHVHGTNPQFLIEKVIRARIYDSPYWKEHCFALTAESFVDRAVALEYIGGTFGLQKPTPFVCLVCKLLQLQPDKAIILEYLRYPEFKYLRAVAAMYVRLTFSAFDVFATLEPLMNDYRKLRFRQMGGDFSLTYMDVFIDDLLTQERVCQLILPRLPRRDVLEETEGLAPRTSKLEDVLLFNQDANEARQSDASDDSADEERRERLKRVERARRVRQQRMEEEQRRSIQVDALSKKSEEDGEEVGYPSQEEEEEEDEAGMSEPAYVSRSPSRSVSPDNGYQSRSPSRSPDRSSEPRSDGFRSRSISRSPERM